MKRQHLDYRRVTLRRVEPLVTCCYPVGRGGWTNEYGSCGAKIPLIVSRKQVCPACGNRQARPTAPEPTPDSTIIDGDAVIIDADLAVPVCVQSVSMVDAYRLRTEVEPRPTLAMIAELLGLRDVNAAQHAYSYGHRLVVGTPPTRRTRRTATTVESIRFGIEIEFNGGGYGLPDRIVAATVAAGINARTENYNHTTRTWWKMVHDATVSGGEFVSPPMAGDRASIDEVVNVVNVVKAQGGTTGRNVGMHVHLNVQDLDRAALVRLARTFRSFERALCSFVPSHRYNYSQPHAANLIDQTEWERIINRLSVDDSFVNRTSCSTRQAFDAIGVSRYRSINWHALVAYGTVEVRLLGHTLNTAKVRAWIEVCQAIVRAAKHGHEIDVACDAATMVEWLTANGGLRRWAADRFTQEVSRRAAA